MDNGLEELTATLKKLQRDIDDTKGMVDAQPIADIERRSEEFSSTVRLLLKLIDARQP